jgi:hypothetical protein
MTSHEASWWVWIAWLERENGGGFVYGCAARTLRPAGWSEDRAIEIPGAGQLRISQHLVRDDVFGVFRDALDAGAVAPIPFSAGRWRRRR